MTSLVDELVASGEISAAVALVGTSTEIRSAVTANVPSAALFDLASLTKGVVGTLAVVLAEGGVLPLDLTVSEVFPQAAGPLAEHSLADLLRHRSGLAAWAPLGAEVENPEGVVAHLLAPGSWEGGQERYSDLGFILWGLVAERRLGSPLADLLARRVTVPLGLEKSVVAPPGEAPPAVASLLSNEREVELAAARGVAIAPEPGPWRGVPQDGNARFMGGVPGHAGLFGTATALWRLGAAWLRPGELMSPQSVAAALAGEGKYALGWWRAERDGAAGPALSAAAFGMVGFTGGSLWIDPEQDLVCVLLTHRRRADFDLTPWRQRFHQLAVTL